MKQRLNPFSDLPSAFKLALGCNRGRALVGSMCLYSVFLVAAVFSSDVASVCMRRFHTDLPYGVWALLQPAPSMYSYDNEASYTGTAGQVTQQVNHHPYRVLGDSKSWWLKEHQGKGEMVLTSRYRGTVVTTRFAVTDKGSHVVIER